MFTYQIDFWHYNHSAEWCYVYEIHIYIHFFYTNTLSLSSSISFHSAILRRGFAFSASIKNPPLLKSRNIQSQASITANVPVPLIGGAQPVQIKETSKQQQPHHHTSTAGSTKHTQIQQKISNESIDLSCASPSQQSKNEHIVWPKQVLKSTATKMKQKQQNTICNYLRKSLLDIVIVVLPYSDCIGSSSYELSRILIPNTAHIKHSLCQIVLSQSIFQ